MDLEIGLLLNAGRAKALRIAPDVRLVAGELPAVEQLAAIVHRGMDDHFTTYTALGRWLEQQHYRIIGPGREMLLADEGSSAPERCVTEIAFPVERIIGAELGFLESP